MLQVIKIAALILFFFKKKYSHWRILESASVLGVGTTSVAKLLLCLYVFSVTGLVSIII